MLLTRTSLLIDRSKTERTYFLCIHVRWNWTQMCYVTSVIRHMVRLIECHRSMIPRKKKRSDIYVLTVFLQFAVGK